MSDVEKISTRIPTPAEMIILLNWWGFVLHGLVLRVHNWLALYWDYMNPELGSVLP